MNTTVKDFTELKNIIVEQAQEYSENYSDRPDIVMLSLIASEISIELMVLADISRMLFAINENVASSVTDEIDQNIREIRNRLYET